MSEELTCVICEADFRANVMVGNKCSQCNELYPKAKTKEEVTIKFKNKAETLTEKRVKELVYEILEEIGFSQSVCDSCKKDYYRRSPAQKVCKGCSAKDNK